MSWSLETGCDLLPLSCVFTPCRLESQNRAHTYEAWTRSSFLETRTLLGHPREPTAAQVSCRQFWRLRANETEATTSICCPEGTPAGPRDCWSASQGKPKPTLSARRAVARRRGRSHSGGWGGGICSGRGARQARGEAEFQPRSARSLGRSVSRAATGVRVAYNGGGRN